MSHTTATGGTQQPVPGHIAALCIPMGLCASVSPRPAPPVPYLCWGSGGVPGSSPPPPRVADGPCGQEPPAGDGAHSASAGHRLVPPQRQRHRQRLRGHHRHGEGRAAGGLRRAPPPPIPFPLLCCLQSVTGLFLAAVPCVCVLLAAAAGSMMQHFVLNIPSPRLSTGGATCGIIVLCPPPQTPRAPRAPCSIGMCVGMVAAPLRLIVPVSPPGVADPRLRPRAQHHGAGGDAGGALQARGHHLLAPHGPQRAAECRWGSPQVPWDPMVVNPKSPPGTNGSHSKSHWGSMGVTPNPHWEPIAVTSVPTGDQW